MIVEIYTGRDGVGVFSFGRKKKLARRKTPREKDQVAGVGINSSGAGNKIGQRWRRCGAACQD